MDDTILITDQDVLSAIATDDEIATDLDASFSAAVDHVTSAALMAWQADLKSYRAWAVDAKAKAEGGFFLGQWVGVPDAYHTAINWGTRLKHHAADLPAGTTPPNLPDLPSPSSPTNLTPSLGTDTKLLIALVAVAVIIVARKF
jgi:hypothetical protein